MEPSRVLILGGSSYVAQFILQRYLDDAESAAGDTSSHDGRGSTLVMGCTLRNDDCSPLPAGFSAVLYADAATAASPLPLRAANNSTSGKSSATCSSHSDIQVYCGVDLATMTGVHECIHHFRPDVVVNCIAMSSPAACEKEPEHAAAINEPCRLVEFLAHEVDWDICFMHFSTDFVYDGVTPPPLGYSETDAGGSQLTVYGTSKLRFDHYLLAHDSSSLHGIVFRIANVVGPRAPLELGATSQPPKFMEWLHRQLFCETQSATETESERTPLRLWNDEVRSYIYVRDLVDVVFAFLMRDWRWSTLESPNFLLLNVGGIDALSRVELADKYCAAWQRASSRAVRCAEIAPTSRASVDLGYLPPLDARLDTTRLHETLPSLHLTPTDVFMDTIFCELSATTSSPK